MNLRFWRIWIRHNIFKGFLLGLLLVYVLYVQNIVETIDKPFRRRFVGHDFRLASNLSKDENYMLILRRQKIHQIKRAINASQPNKEFEYRKSRIEIENDWREVNGSKKTIFVYSAYFDIRNPTKKVVRIVAIIKKKLKVTLCKIYFSNGTSITVPARTKELREGWTLPFISTFINCELPTSLNRTVLYAAIRLQGVNVYYPKIKVVQMQDSKNEGFMSVCVKAFHYEYNRAIWLVEFIEMHLLLGVNKFIFYNHTVGPDVEVVLKHYILKGVVEVHQWSLPVKSQKHIRTEALSAALNDCNLKSVNRFNYSIMIDLDEFIIPRNFSNYTTMLKSLGEFNSYVFQNAFFYLYWPNDTTATDILYNRKEAEGTQLFGLEYGGPYLLTSYKTTRLSIPHKHNQRSKYIVKPHKIIECGNHVVWEGLDGHRRINVPSKVAVLHHYRICEFGGFACLNAPNVIDRSAHKWMLLLIEKLALSCSEMFTDTGVCPPAPPLGDPW